MQNMELMEALQFEKQQEKHIDQEQHLGDSGMSTVEIILILVVLIALVIIFKSQITTLVMNIFESINKSAAGIY